MDHIKIILHTFFHDTNISQNGIDKNLYFHKVERPASGRSYKVLKLCIKTHSSESRGQEN